MHEQIKISVPAEPGFVALLRSVVAGVAGSEQQHSERRLDGRDTAFQWPTRRVSSDRESTEHPSGSPVAATRRCLDARNKRAIPDHPVPCDFRPGVSRRSRSSRTKVRKPVRRRRIEASDSTSRAYCEPRRAFGIVIPRATYQPLTRRQKSSRWISLCKFQPE